MVLFAKPGWWCQSPKEHPLGCLERDASDLGPVAFTPPKGRLTGLAARDLSMTLWPRVYQQMAKDSLLCLVFGQHSVGHL